MLFRLVFLILLLGCPLVVEEVQLIFEYPFTCGGGFKTKMS